QYNFIKKVAGQLNVRNLTLIKGDVFKFLATVDTPFDIVFADPPYTLEDFGRIPGLILESGAVAPGTIVVVEHSKAYDFSQLPGFIDHRTYGSVNFSIFRVGE
ncbi:MAG: RsmD family RNA methyltransferase, partial [Muribaculaceae bacterium]|nr:RsmD family RNA methyltransferase [Muribaculaceae bacterium]